MLLAEFVDTLPANALGVVEAMSANTFVSDGLNNVVKARKISNLFVMYGADDERMMIKRKSANELAFACFGGKIDKIAALDVAEMPGAHDDAFWRYANVEQNYRCLLDSLVFIETLDVDHLPYPGNDVWTNSMLLIETGVFTLSY